MPAFTLLIHGGAGMIEREAVPPDLEREYRSALEATLRAGAEVLRAGGSSLDAVEVAVTLLEDNPLFNAGRGAVFTSAGTHELEASIVDGATLRSGGVFGLRHVANPVKLARRVMEHTPHALLGGDGAEAFAREEGFPARPQKYFSTERRRLQLENDRQLMGAAGLALSEDAATYAAAPAHDPTGTVGAVALDRAGNLAAATSTGGMSNKRPGRVGDSAIIGAGCYADNATCAVSATGHGEMFLRHVVAHDIAARVAYLGQTPREAAGTVVLKTLVRAGGRGGVIVLDRHGNFAMPFNSSGMYRGSVRAGEEPQVAIYPEE
jgi:beta-aspartyl-peptidase (threonine type)